MSFKDPATCKITTSPVLFPHIPAPDSLVPPTRAAAVSIGSRRATVRPSAWAAMAAAVPARLRAVRVSLLTRVRVANASDGRAGRQAIQVLRHLGATD